MANFERRLTRLINSGQQHLLCGGLKGLEKESLRVSPDGSIAQTPHPAALGSALCHPALTTDYSEALLELVTSPDADSSRLMGQLQDLHGYVYRQLDDEFLWATSMPCVLAGEDRIPIAQYGSSNLGMMKTVYRRGLGYRYGRVMQVIAGVHFNYSVPEALWPVLQQIEGDGDDLRGFRDRYYMGMVRNLLRYGWLIPYLLGASPAVCKSFFGEQPSRLAEFDQNTYFEPYATSLRMGDIGYQNRREEGVGVKAVYDNLQSYVASLRHAIETPAPLWEEIGVEVDGYWRQLNANILQIENEYYNSVRPKQLLDGLEKPVNALSRRGIRYVELRSLDVNAYHPLGVDETQLRFLETFMLFALLHDSAPFDRRERWEVDRNLERVAHQGRDPALMLHRHGESALMKTWAIGLLNDMLEIADLLDHDLPGKPYTRAVQEQQEKVLYPDATPSAQMLLEMRENGEAFYHLARRMSERHRDYFAALPLSEASQQRLDRQRDQSLATQQQMEAEPQKPFGEFLADYLAS